MRESEDCRRILTHGLQREDEKVLKPKNACYRLTEAGGSRVDAGVVEGAASVDRGDTVAFATWNDNGGAVRYGGVCGMLPVRGADERRRTGKTIPGHGSRARRKTRKDLGGRRDLHIHTRLIGYHHPTTYRRPFAHTPRDETITARSYYLYDSCIARVDSSLTVTPIVVALRVVVDCAARNNSSWTVRHKRFNFVQSRYF